MPWRLIDPARNPRARAIAHTIAGLSVGLLFVSAVVGLTAGVYLINAVRETQVSNTQRAEADRERDERTAATARDAANAAERIEECTTPGLPCFEESQERLGQTVGTLNRYALAAAYCADRPGAQTIAQLEACIRAAVEASQRASSRSR